MVPYFLRNEVEYPTEPIEDLTIKNSLTETWPILDNIIAFCTCMSVLALLVTLIQCKRSYKNGHKVNKQMMSALKRQFIYFMVINVTDSFYGLFVLFNNDNSNWFGTSFYSNKTRGILYSRGLIIPFIRLFEPNVRY